MKGGQLVIEANEYLKRTWAVIDLEALAFNVCSIKSSLGDEKIIGVVKADGYGHGDIMTANTLIKNGVDFLAVSNLEEALSLRRQKLLKSESGIAKILILGYTPATMAGELAKADIVQTVFSLEYAKELSLECQKQGVTACVHLKIDTGMNRLGLTENEQHCADDEVCAICGLKGLAVEGVFSHLSSADMTDAESEKYTLLQQRRFDGLVERLKNRGIVFSYCHLENSAGISVLESKSYTHARAGIVLYGVAPSDEIKLPFPLKPVMSIKTVISMIKEVDENEAVSYGRRYVTGAKMRIATVPIGYADGYSRFFSNKAYMLLNGQRVKVIGNVCMDQLMLDVSNVPEAKEGDVVTVVGQDGAEYLGFNMLAELIGTIGYELMCLVSRRVPRIYVENGRTVSVLDYIG